MRVQVPQRVVCTGHSNSNHLSPTHFCFLVVTVLDSCLLQVPQRVVCTGYSNAGAYAQLCGIWAAIQWPAAPVRVITWGAPVVSLDRIEDRIEAGYLVQLPFNSMMDSSGH